MDEIYKRYTKEFKEIEQELLALHRPWLYYTLAVLYELVEVLGTELEQVNDLKDFFERHHLRDFQDMLVETLGENDYDDPLYLKILNHCEVMDRSEKDGN